MQKVRAAVCREFGAPLVIEEITLLDPEPDEVQVTLEACAICHSDISYIEGGWGGELPAIYGHEAAGTVTAIGASAKGYAIGDKVIVTLMRSCGQCPSCATANPIYCEDSTPPAGSPLRSQDDEVIARAMNCGAFAEKVNVHPSQIAKIPSDMRTDSACLLACGVLTGVGSVVQTAKVRAGEIVTVIGAGGVGLNAIQGARIAGASRIIAVDLLPEKLDMAREFGATDVVLGTEPEPWKMAAAAAGGRLADVVLVTVGAIPAFEQAPRFMGRGGRMILVGMNHAGEYAQYDPSVFAAIGQSMIGAKLGDAVLSRDIPWLIDMYEQGRLKLDELISDHWSLDQINEAIADTKSGAAKRNVIRF